MYKTDQPALYHLTARQVSPKVDTLVIPELSVCHVTMVSYDLPHMLWRHILLLSFNKAKLSLLTVTL